MSGTSTFIEAHLQDKIIDKLSTLSLSPHDILMINYLEVSYLKIQRTFPEAAVHIFDNNLFQDIELKTFDLVLWDLIYSHPLEFRNIISKIVSLMNDRTMIFISVLKKLKDKHFLQYQKQMHIDETELKSILKNYKGMDVKYYSLPVLTLPCKTIINAQLFLISKREVLKAELKDRFHYQPNNIQPVKLKRGSNKTLQPKKIRKRLTAAYPSSYPKKYEGFLENRKKQIEEGITWVVINESEFQKKELERENITEHKELELKNLKNKNTKTT